MRQDLEKRKPNSSLLAHSTQRVDDGTSPIDEKLYLSKTFGFIDKSPDNRVFTYRISMWKACLKLFNLGLYLLTSGVIYSIAHRYDILKNKQILRL